MSYMLLRARGPPQSVVGRPQAGQLRGQPVRLVPELLHLRPALPQVLLGPATLPLALQLTLQAGVSALQLGQLEHTHTHTHTI